MALYAVGDVQGCLACLDRLLGYIGFQADDDRLWFVGDLVNRGPDSAGVLRRVRELNAETVLGNHDLHLLAVAAGARRVKSGDSFDDVLEAPDRDGLIEWLSTRPLLVRDDVIGWLMVHAGLPPAWDVTAATTAAREVEEWLARHGRDAGALQGIYGDHPDRWRPGLEGMERVRYIINALTRLRFCNAESRLALAYSGPPGVQPAGFEPWFRLWRSDTHRVVFGHWSRLGAGDHGTAVSTDSGCVWGGQLSAARLAPAPVELFAVSCERCLKSQ